MGMVVYVGAVDQVPSNYCVSVCKELSYYKDFAFLKGYCSVDLVVIFLPQVDDSNDKEEPKSIAISVTGGTEVVCGVFVAVVLVLKGFDV